MGTIDTSVQDVGVWFTETVAPLGGGATFTGPWRDTVFYNWCAALALTDQNAGAGQGLCFDEADAAAPTIINTVSVTGAGVAPITGNANSPAAGFVFRVLPTKILERFVRVRFVNGATPQTRLVVRVTMSPLN